MPPGGPGRARQGPHHHAVVPAPGTLAHAGQRHRLHRWRARWPGCRPQAPVPGDVAPVRPHPPPPHGSHPAGGTAVSGVGYHDRASLPSGLINLSAETAYMNKRRTKIVATLGPASSSPEKIEQLLLAGLDVARLNFSHGTPDEHRERVRMLREISAKLGRHTAIMGDLQGPKIRIARFRDTQVTLEKGQPFTLSNAHSPEDGNERIVGIDYPSLVQDCQPGDELLLDDGRVVLHVDSVDEHSVHTTVVVGGPLSNNKGINRRGGGISAPRLTEIDHEDIRLAAELELDYVAVSFPRYGRDIEDARKLVRAAGSEAWIIAKI